jgi:hypothetical protein
MSNRKVKRRVNALAPPWPENRVWSSQSCSFESLDRRLDWSNFRPPAGFIPLSPPSDLELFDLNVSFSPELHLGHSKKLDFRASKRSGGNSLSLPVHLKVL